MRRMPNGIPIQSGARTHHHDHVMTWQSLSTINAMANKPTKPIPDEEDELDETDFDMILIIN
jgi:hypothetical protein